MTEWTYSLGGVTFGAGTRIGMAAPPSGLGTPGVRAGDVDIPSGHGAFPVADYMEARTLGFELTVRGDTPTEAMTLTRQLAHAWSPSSATTPGATVPLRMHLPGFGPYYLIGRPRRFEAITARLKAGLIDVAADYVAHDPLFYGEEQEVTLALGGTVTSDGTGQVSYGKGLQAPLVAPLVLNAAPTAPEGAVDVPGKVRVEGNSPTWPSYEFRGPMLGPRLQLGSYVLSFPELNLGVNDVLRVDTHPARRSILMGGVNRYSYLARGRRLKSLEPSVYAMRFTARTYDSRARATVRWRSGFTA